MLLALRESIRQDVQGWFRDLEVQHVLPWGFLPAEIDLPEGSVYLWHGEQDRVVPSAWGRYVVCPQRGPCVGNTSSVDHACAETGTSLPPSRAVRRRSLPMMGMFRCGHGA